MVQTGNKLRPADLVRDLRLFYITHLFSSCQRIRCKDWTGLLRFKQDSFWLLGSRVSCFQPGLDVYCLVRSDSSVDGQSLR